MAKFVTIGERLSTTAPAVNKAFTERDPEPIIKRAKQQLDAGATYLDVNIGPAENDGEDLMKWAVQLLQSEFDNVPLALDTTNKKAIEAGISVYNRAKGKPIVNSADAGDRISNIDLAAANDAICIALCSSGMAWEKGKEPYYPVNDPKNSELFDKYERRALEEKNVIFGGRLGMYRYMDMDQVIEEALSLAETELTYEEP